MSNSIVNSILEMIEEQRMNIRKIFVELSDDEINWCPQTKRNSIANLIEHATGAEAWWVQEAIMDIDVKRVREKEFEYRYRSKKELATSYEYAAKATKEILSKLNDEELFKEKNVRETKRTILWILLHVLEHTNYHIGQIQYIRSLLTGDKFLDRPKKNK